MEDRNILLVGEGTNRHVLYGKADFYGNGRFRGFEMRKDGLLRHEDPFGAHGEHSTLAVEMGCWVMGRQIEFNPFHFGSHAVLTDVWD